MITVLSEIFLFLVRAASELRAASYGFKHALWSSSYAPFCAYLHTQLENWRLYKDVLPIKWLLYDWRYLFSGSELYLRYNRQVMDPNTHCNLFPIWHFCILILITQKLPVINGLSTYQMTALLSEMSYSVLELDVRYSRWVKAPNRNHSLFLISYCAYLHVHA